MKRIFSLALQSLVTTTLIAADSMPFYDKEMAIKTKEILMISQLSDKGLSVEVSGDINGKRSFFSSFSENNDMRWKGSVNIIANVNHCGSIEGARQLEQAGFKLKSRIADGTVVAYREAIKQLKDNGAKYIFLSKYVYIGDLPEEIIMPEDKTISRYIATAKGHPDQNIIQRGVPFADYFSYLLKNDTFLQSENIRVRNLPNECLNRSDSNIKDWLHMAGQATALAIGAKGASLGNSNMVTLATGASSSIDNTFRRENDGRKSSLDVYTDNKKLAAILRRTSINMVGFIDSMYIEKNEENKNYYGYIFPIEEVEEHLSHYKVIPYTVGKIVEH